jgi:hypothetical protein
MVDQLATLQISNLKLSLKEISIIIAITSQIAITGYLSSEYIENYLKVNLHGI